MFLEQKGLLSCAAGLIQFPLNPGIKLYTKQKKPRINSHGEYLSTKMVHGHVCTLIW